jgi:hypothetical protein
MIKNSDECWHVLIRLPNGLLYDGGHGIHIGRTADHHLDQNHLRLLHMFIGQ